MKKLLLLIIFSIFLFANNSILVVNSYHKGYEFSDTIISGLENSLYQNNNLDINILYMDSKRVTSKSYYENLKKLYSVQLKNRKYDLIIAIDRFAYDFVLKNYNSFFTDEKILAVGIENFSIKKAKKYNLENKVSALIEKRDLKSNVELIRTIFPSIKKLYIINDKSLNALHTEPLIYDLINNFKGSFDLDYIKENNLKSLEDRFSKKDETSAALFIRFYKNKNGELNKNKEIAKFIKNSKIPIFVTDSLFIKKGATGGKVVDLKKLGNTSGQMALNILDKKSKGVINSEDLYYVFDSKKLREFSLPVDALKQKYTVVNKEKTFFDKHRGFINFVFAFSPILLILIVFLIHNIYMKKKIEKELRERIEFDEVLLNAIESPIFWENEKGIIVESNKKFCSLLNLDAKDIYGKKLIDFHDKVEVQKIIEILNKYAQNSKKNYEFKYVDKLNKKRVYLIKQEKFEDEKSRKKGLVTIFTDITKEKEIVKEKEKNRQFIVQQSKLAEIGEIFSSIAHQWKTPLIEITAIAQELFYSKKCEEVKEDESFVKDIMTQVTYMNDTINEFQKFIIPSREKNKFNVYEAIKSTLEIVNHNMKYNNIKIDIKVKENTNLYINAYKNEFMQTFLNVINNAKDALLKNDYKNRFIKIELFNEDEDLVLTIEDNAGGILEENINKIFKPYYTTKKEGHGIGLYMSKVIIEDKMNGKIEVQNINDGAIFEIKLEQNK